MTIEQLFNGLIAANDGTNPNLTVSDLEVYVGGSNGGPSVGGTLDIGVFAGLPLGIIVCTTLPLCYNVLAENCVTINVECEIMPPEEVPTISEWGLIVLSLLILIIGLVSIRQSKLEETIG